MLFYFIQCYNRSIKYIDQSIQYSSQTSSVFPLSLWSYSQNAFASIMFDIMIYPCPQLTMSCRVITFGCLGFAMSNIQSLMSSTWKPDFSFSSSFSTIDLKNMLMMKVSMAPLWQTSRILQKYWIACGVFLFSTANTKSRKPLQSIQPLQVWYSQNTLSITMSVMPQLYFASQSLCSRPFLSESSRIYFSQRFFADCRENQLLLISYVLSRSFLSSQSSARMGEVSMSLMQILPVRLGSKKKKNLRLAVMQQYVLKLSQIFQSCLKLGMMSLMQSQRSFYRRQPFPTQSYSEMWILVWNRFDFRTIEWKKEFKSIRPNSSRSNLRKVEALKKYLHLRGRCAAMVRKELQLILYFPSMGGLMFSLSRLNIFSRSDLSSTYEDLCLRNLFLASSLTLCARGFQLACDFWQNLGILLKLSSQAYQIFLASQMQPKKS